MKIRPVDENGDMMPITSLSQMYTGAKAVGLLASFRINLIRGEWWEDETLGFKMWDYLLQGVRQGDSGMLSNYISSYISQTKGCTSVTNVSTTYANRALLFGCTVNTSEGSTNMEVTEDELFAAVY